MSLERQQPAGLALQLPTEALRPLVEAVVTYDHPFHAPLDHAINIDFVDADKGLKGRASVELTVDGARQLARTILAAVDQAEQLHPSA